MTQYKIILEQARIADIPFGGNQTPLMCTGGSKLSNSRKIVDDCPYSIYLNRQFHIPADGLCAVEHVRSPFYILSFWLPEGTKVVMKQELLPSLDKYDQSLPNLRSLESYKFELPTLQNPFTHLPSTKVEKWCKSESYGHGALLQEHPVQLQYEGYTTFTLDFSEATAQDYFTGLKVYTFHVDEYVPPQ